MANTRLVVDSNNRYTFWMDDQHISRMTHEEVREFVLQVIVFGGQKLRDEFREWLTRGNVDQVASFLCPEIAPKAEAPNAD